LSDFLFFLKKFSAETVIEIANRFIAICGTHISSFGGEIHSLMGDGIMAVFPIDHLDHAIEAGINILSDLETMRKKPPDREN
jgi:class 3 adenylate cyclase